ncbi:hypothetical protein FA15DRAFT_728831 [Coprinopsis marcescibilis]|uniref:DUF4139 domain-containing protein n=1 Tax=Coprinopsis marcescibilis TaxID=230819 RepID=A0A5C3KF55_COPMA|nr:hypothetical protein FA15DRAFT_728831 [Coprinopsis marcescibilis]
MWSQCTIPSLKTVKLGPRVYDNITPSPTSTTATTTRYGRKVAIGANTKAKGARTRLQPAPRRQYQQAPQQQPHQAKPPLLQHLMLPQTEPMSSQMAQDFDFSDPVMQRSKFEGDLTDLFTVGPAPVAIAETTTVVNETPVAVTFSVLGELTIPSDGIDHQCRVKNNSDYRLLPGSVMVIYDEIVVSTTRISDINTGDEFECTLGDDASPKVTYSHTLKTEKSRGTFTETTNTTTCITKITVHNKHTFDNDDLVVRHIIPICEDKRGQVILRKPDGLATAEVGQIVSLQGGLKVAWTKFDGNDSMAKTRKVGYEWSWKVSSGGKVNLEAEWDAKVPGESAWHDAQV